MQVKIKSMTVSYTVSLITSSKHRKNLNNMNISDSKITSMLNANTMFSFQKWQQSH